MADPVTVYGSITKAIDIVRSLKDFEKRFDAAQFKLQLAELTEALADAKLAVLGLRDEVEAKEKELAQVRKSFDRKSNTVTYDGFQYELRDDGKAEGWPFCPRCMQVDTLAIKLVTHPIKARSSYCPECKTTYRNAKAESYRALRPDLYESRS